MQLRLCTVVLIVRVIGWCIVVSCLLRIRSLRGGVGIEVIDDES